MTHRVTHFYGTVGHKGHYMFGHLSFYMYEISLCCNATEAEDAAITEKAWVNVFRDNIGGLMIITMGGLGALYSPAFS